LSLALGGIAIVPLCRRDGNACRACIIFILMLADLVLVVGWNKVTRL
jgi:hypothetical protein